MNTLINTEKPVISEMLCVPIGSGQVLVELHLKQRILTDDPVPYSRKRRVKHTFVVCDGDNVVTFEVAARASVVRRAGKSWISA